MYHIDEFPTSSREDILFNLGGVINHNLYWKGISLKKERNSIGKLMFYIEEMFGSYELFFEKFKEKAMQLKGAGYTF